METIDIVVLCGSFLLFALWSIDMFGTGTFESAAPPAAIGASLTSMAGLYLIAGGNPWITGLCAFLALAYAITAVALKGKP